MQNDVTIAICNFNTTELTNNCIQSIQLNCKNFLYKFVILDNSNKTSFSLASDFNYDTKIEIINNTTGKYVNFNQVLQKCPFKLMKNNANNYGSLKHAASIQFLLNICTTKILLLFDSDTILHKDIDFIDMQYASIADLEENGKNGRNGKLYTSFTRFMPFIQFFNIDMIQKKKIRYFDYARMHGVLAPNRGNYYDTGASFYADLVKNNLQFKRINYKDYIKHLDHGSWIDNFNKYLK